MSTRSDALLSAETGVLLPAVARAVIAMYRPLLTPLSLTHPQYLVLLALADGQDHTVHDIAQQLSVSDGTMSPLLRRLETLGHITLDRNGQNRRELDVSLTATGSALLPQLRDISATIRYRIGMTPEDIQHLTNLLTA